MKKKNISISKRILESGNILTLVDKRNDIQTKLEQADFNAVVSHLYLQREIKDSLEIYYIETESGDRVLHIGIMSSKKHLWNGE